MRNEAQRVGRGAPSRTRMRSAFCTRVCISSHAAHANRMRKGIRMWNGLAARGQCVRVRERERARESASQQERARESARTSKRERARERAGERARESERESGRASKRERARERAGERARERERERERASKRERACATECGRQGRESRDRTHQDGHLVVGIVAVCAALLPSPTPLRFTQPCSRRGDTCRVVQSQQRLISHLKHSHRPSAISHICHAISHAISPHQPHQPPATGHQPSATSQSQCTTRVRGAREASGGTAQTHARRARGELFDCGSRVVL